MANDSLGHRPDLRDLVRYVDHDLLWDVLVREYVQPGHDALAQEAAVEVVVASLPHD